MASETVASDHSITAPEEVERVKEEVKTVEQDTINPPKESVEEERLKVEDSPSPAVPLAESDEKIEDKKTESPVEEVKKTGEEEKPKAQDSPSSAVPLAESDEKTEDKKTEVSAVEEVKKTDGNAVLDVSVEDNTKAAEAPTPEPEIPIVLEPASGDVKTQPEEQPAVQIVEKQPIEESTTKHVQEKASELSKIVDITESLLQAVEKKEEQVEVSPIKESEVAKVKDAEISAEPQKEETQEALPVVEEKPKELPEVAEPVEEPRQIDPKETEEIQKVEDVVSPVNKVEDTESLKEEKITREAPLVTESSDKITSTNQEAQNAEKELPKEEVAELGKTEAENEGEDATIKEDGEKKVLIEESNPPESKISEGVNSSISTSEVAEKSVEGDNTSTEIEAKAAKIEDGTNAVIEESNQPETKKAKDVSSSIPTTEVIEKSVEGENTSRDIEAKDANVGEDKDKDKEVAIEESSKPEKKVAEDVSSSIPPIEVTERSLEAENTSRDTEPVAKNVEENVNDGTVASVETSKDGEVERKVDETTIEKPKKSEADVKGEERPQTGETKLEKEEVHEIAKPEVPNEESKDGDDTKTSKDPPKEEVLVKSTPKQSNNIISKVKHSLVKAKKAILGKSPNSKTPSSETKGDDKAK